MKELAVFVGLFSLMRLCMVHDVPNLNCVEGMDAPLIKTMRVSEDAPDSVRIEYTLNKPVALINGKYAVLEDGGIAGAAGPLRGLIPIHVGRDVDLRDVCRIIPLIHGGGSAYGYIDEMRFAVEDGLLCWRILLKTGPSVYMGCVDDFDGRALLRLEWLVRNELLNNRGVEYVKLYFEDKAVFKVREGSS